MTDSKIATVIRLLRIIPCNLKADTLTKHEYWLIKIETEKMLKTLKQHVNEGHK